MGQKILSRKSVILDQLIQKEKALVRLESSFVSPRHGAPVREKWSLLSKIATTIRTTTAMEKLMSIVVVLSLVVKIPNVLSLAVVIVSSAKVASVSRLVSNLVSMTAIALSPAVGLFHGV
tara:strand:- start:407 stop:766 length:360 start_codon:yes stop_codon:yes gene_type:complete